jgi:acyl carrier protein
MNDATEKVLKVLGGILAEKGMPPVTAGSDTLAAPFDVLGLDSMDRLDFAMGLEDAFGTVFVTSEMLKCKTLADIISFAERETAR